MTSRGRSCGARSKPIYFNSRLAVMPKQTRLCPWRCHHPGPRHSAPHSPRPSARGNRKLGILEIVSHRVKCANHDGWNVQWPYVIFFTLTAGRAVWSVVTRDVRNFSPQINSDARRIAIALSMKSFLSVEIMGEKPTQRPFVDAINITAKAVWQALEKEEESTNFVFEGLKSATVVKVSWKPLLLLLHLCFGSLFVVHRAL